jgi:SAM-dependent methyltransferase
MYDTFSSDYDRFVNWENRLASELPFLEAQLQAVWGPGGEAPRVLDAACATGMHVIALAGRGYPATGADLSAAMIERARANAVVAGAQTHFEAAGFGALAATFGRQSFEALLCLGNSLPHLLDRNALAGALADFAACLRPGGLLLVQIRNFDAVLAGRERWMEPQAHREGEREWLFLRFYDFEPDGLINFNVVTLFRAAADPLSADGWQQRVASTRLYPLRAQEALALLDETGFGQIDLYGNMAGSPFDPAGSGNLVIAARAR